MSMTAWHASSWSAATMTPFPAASPLAFTTSAGKSALRTQHTHNTIFPKSQRENKDCWALYGLYKRAYNWDQTCTQADCRCLSCQCCGPSVFVVSFNDVQPVVTYFKDVPLTWTLTQDHLKITCVHLQQKLNLCICTQTHLCKRPGTFEHTRFIAIMTTHWATADY